MGCWRREVARMVDCRGNPSSSGMPAPLPKGSRPSRGWHRTFCKEHRTFRKCPARFGTCSAPSCKMGGMACKGSTPIHRTPNERKEWPEPFSERCGASPEQSGTLTAWFRTLGANRATVAESPAHAPHHSISPLLQASGWCEVRPGRFDSAGRAAQDGGYSRMPRALAVAHSLFA